jgi:hypothetical protein
LKARLAKTLFSLEVEDAMLYSKSNRRYLSEEHSWYDLKVAIVIFGCGMPRDYGNCIMHPLHPPWKLALGGELWDPRN